MRRARLVEADDPAAAHSGGRQEAVRVRSSDDGTDRPRPGGAGVRVTARAAAV